MKRPNQVLLRLSDESIEALERLCKRWSVTPAVMMNSVIIQLERRKDLTSLLDVSGKTSHVDLLRHIWGECHKAICAAEKMQ